MLKNLHISTVTEHNNEMSVILKSSIKCEVDTSDNFINYYFVLSVPIVLGGDMQKTVTKNNAPHAKNIVHCIK